MYPAGELAVLRQLLFERSEKTKHRRFAYLHLPAHKKYSKVNVL